MTVQTKAKGSSAAAELEAETAQEIEQIMSEIDDLQREMDKQGPVTPPKAPAAVSESAEDTMEPQDDTMQEFRGESASDGPSMEETLGDLKEEETETNSNSILDQAIQADAEADAELEAAAGAADLDDEAETAAAIAALEGTPEDSGEEEVTVEDAGETTEDTMDEVDFDDSEGAGGDGDGTLTMTLKGNMNLKLKYETDGREVTVAFTGETLKIQLMDGTEFKIPVRRKPALKRVA